MSNEAFIKWKSENRDEYDTVLLSVMELVFKDLLKPSLDDPFLMSIHPDPDTQRVERRLELTSNRWDKLTLIK